MSATKGLGGVCGYCTEHVDKGGDTGSSPRGSERMANRSVLKKTAQPSHAQPYCCAGEHSLAKKAPVYPRSLSAGSKKSSAHHRRSIFKGRAQQGRKKRASRL